MKKTNINSISKIKPEILEEKLYNGTFFDYVNTLTVDELYNAAELITKSDMSGIRMSILKYLSDSIKSRKNNQYKIKLTKSA